jgi:hypothetical protein
MSVALVKKMLKSHKGTKDEEDIEDDEKTLEEFFDNFMDYEFGDEPLSIEELLG